MKPPSLAELVAERRSEIMVAAAFARKERACAPTGIRNGARRSLTAEQVQEIRRRVSEGESRKAIARDLGVDPSTVGQVASRRSYRWVREVP